MRTLLALSFVAVGSLTVAGDVSPKALEGKWEVVSVTRDGKADAALKGAVREHAGDKYTVTPAAGSSAATVGGTFSVDGAKSPATIDMMPAGGRYKGQTLKGIVKLDGDDLTVAFAEPGKDRPTAFDGAAGVVVAVHKRAK